jgi:membrane-bound ClpP family serine protease
MSTLHAVNTLRRRSLLAELVAGGLLVAVCFSASAIRAQDQAAPPEAPAADPGQPPPKHQHDAAVKRIGRVIKIDLPVTGKTYNAIRPYVLRLLEQAKAAGARPVLIFEFNVPPDARDFAAASEFGASYQLADFLSSDTLNDATTVADIPQPIQGHAVLVALACEEILMGPSAELGPAGVHEPTITAPVRSAYKEIANRRKTIPAEVALGLVDSSRKVLVVETDLSREYVTPEQLEELRKTRTIQSSRVLFEAGQPGRLSADEARELDLIASKAANRREVARVLELRPEDVEEDPSLGGRWKAVRVDLKGPINADSARRAQRLIEDAIRKQQVNFVCLWIDSPGGSPTDSVELATFLAADLEPGKVRTVAYVPNRALADASLVAAACDQIVVGSQAVLGGPGEEEPSAEEIRLTRRALREVIAAKKARSWSLSAAMLDPGLEVFRYTRQGPAQLHEYFSAEELADQPDRGQWDKGERITTPDKPLHLSGKEAVDFGMASDAVDSFAEFKDLYGLENDPAMLEPGWADFLIEALGSPGVAVVLLIIGFVAAYAELHSPGLGIAGFVAAVCFLLFFWSRFLGGTAGWLEVVLFLLGLGCLLLEVFVIPGFGIFGLGGGALILASLILASQTFVFPRNEYQFAEMQRSLFILAAAGAGTIAFVALLNRWLPKTPLFGQMVLEPPVGEEAVDIRRREALAHYEALLDQHGTATTPLVPAGKAVIGEQLVDVIADGEFIPRGTEIVVVEVQGNRVLVRSA